MHAQQLALASSWASSVVLSSCGAYRYVLTRTWDERPPLLCIGLNPSTADAENDDPTIRRCVALAKRQGRGGLRMANLFALRSTDPRKLRAVEDPVGPENTDWIFNLCADAAMVLCAWGNGGAFRNRSLGLSRVLVDAGYTLYALGITKQGHPRHPLYVANSVEPRVWQQREERTYDPL